MRGAKFSDLAGEIITKIAGMYAGSDAVALETESGKRYRLDHAQNCCESVCLEEVQRASRRRVISLDFLPPPDHQGRGPNALARHKQRLLQRGRRLYRCYGGTMTTIRRDSGRIEDVPSGWVQYYRPLSVREIRSSLLRVSPRDGDVPYVRYPGQKWAQRVAIWPSQTADDQQPPSRLRSAFLRILSRR